MAGNSSRGMWSIAALGNEMRYRVISFVVDDFISHWAAPSSEGPVTTCDPQAQNRAQLALNESIVNVPEPSVVPTPFSKKHPPPNDRPITVTLLNAAWYPAAYWGSDPK